MAEKNVIAIVKAQVIDHRLEKSRAKGTPCVTFHALIDNPLAGGPPIDGYVNVWISDKAIGMAKSALKTLDFDIGTRSIYVLQEQPQLLSGKEFEVEVSEEEYNGKIQRRFNFYLGSELVEEDEAKKIDALLRAAPKPKEEKKAAAVPAKRTPKPDPNQAQYDQAVKDADAGEPLF